MSIPDQHRLADALHRGSLNTEEEAQLQEYLAGHPEDRAAWEEELSLNHLLRQLPAAPLSSNFTAQVLNLVRQDTRAPEQRSGWRRALFGRWMPRVATVAALVCVGLFSYRQHQTAERKEMARNLAEVSRMATSPPLEVLENFDAIQRLAQVPQEADQDLIAALSQ